MYNLTKRFSHLIAHSFADEGNGRVARMIWSRSFLPTVISNPRCAAKFFRRINKQLSVTDRFFLSLKYDIDFFTTMALKARCFSCAPSSVRDCLCDSVVQHSMVALQRHLIRKLIWIHEIGQFSVKIDIIYYSDFIKFIIQKTLFWFKWYYHSNDLRNHDKRCV